MKIGLIISLCFTITISKAQDYKKDFLEIYQNYSTLEYYTQEVTIQSFAKEGDNKAAYEGKGKIVKDKNKYFSSLGNQKTIVKNGSFLHVNKEEKRMLFYHQKIDKNAMTEQYSMLLDSMVTTKIQYLGSKNGIKRYLMEDKSQLITKTELSLDMNKKVVSKIVYHYQSTKDYQSSFHKTIITYKTDDKTKPSSSWFDLSPYIHLKNNRATLRSAYKGYSLTQPEEKERKWEDLPK